ncbi:hypothetical protein AB1Y20_016384 [Prymnesium parvum]|uniref:Fe2OG dioxygenase domain-containing protein n=1 Tax=Prymnesium parvum TaxID=97485 RepID=A0AB34IFR4_PRYPA
MAAAEFGWPPSPPEAREPALRSYLAAEALCDAGDLPAAIKLFKAAYSLAWELEAEAWPEWAGAMLAALRAGAPLPPLASPPPLLAAPRPPPPPQWWRAAAAPASLAATLASRQFVVLDGFAPPPPSPPPLAAARAAWHAGAFSAARLAAAGGEAHRNRSDAIAWRPAGLEPLAAAADALVRRLRAACPRLLAPIARRQRPMLSRYARAAVGFARHVDNHCLAGRGERCNGRVLTAVYYMCEGEWDAEAYGGCLRVYRPQQPTEGAEEGGGAAEEAAGDAVADIAPVDGRLVLFFSDFRCPHEVLPVKKEGVERWAVTLWYWNSEPIPEWWVDGVHDCTLVPLEGEDPSCDECVGAPEQPS